MKNNKIPLIIIISLLATGLILNPAFMLTLGIILPTTFFVGNKIVYKNKESELFAIDRKNNITQAIGINIIKSYFIKNKSEYFKKEMVNLLKDLEKNESYKTQSQAIVLKSLRTLEKEEYIEDLEYSVMKYKNKFSENINNLFVNIGMGNYSKLLKGSRKYNISFKRSDKILDDDVLDMFLKNNVNSSKEDDNSITSNKIEHLAATPASEVKKNKLKDLQKDLQYLKQNQEVNNVNYYDNIENKKNTTSR